MTSFESKSTVWKSRSQTQITTNHHNSMTRSSSKWSKWDSHVLLASHILVVLLASFEIHCKRNLKGAKLSPASRKWQQSLFANAAFIIFHLCRLALLLLFFSTLEDSLIVFSAKYLVAKAACAEEPFSAFAFWFCFSPLPFTYVCKTRKAIWAYGHLWWVWMSLRCRSFVVLDVV